VAKAKLKQVEAPRLLKLDLGCGPNPRPGFEGVDALDFGQPIKHDLRKAWPWKDGTVDEVHCSHFLEHLTGAERVHFFNELHRVMIPGGKASIIVPHWSSERAYGDPTHQWPPVVFFSFFYLNAEWRKANAPHSGYTCDFDATGGNSLAHPWMTRNQETQAFAQTHYMNVAQDLHVTITKK
jgi:SAM-dependent methyltransferase